MPAPRSPASKGLAGFRLSSETIADGLRHIDWPAR
jgi:hypothetical protein